ncbi:DUF6069 family protein [Streptomyces sp. NPDC087263]|uniref:DUF6069 family protein n=1 Tax=Streptomyces sp. NPDC087263 TaxID=3365773 RepID=UPI0037FE4048
MPNLTATAPAVRRPGRLVIIGGVLAAIVASSIIEAAVAAIARGAGASDDFMPLHASAFVFFTVLGLSFGAIGWIIVRRRSGDPESLLRKLVPAVLAISFIPDLALLVSDYSPHANAVGVVALLVMHVVVAAVGVFAFHKVLPPGTSEK